MPDLDSLSPAPLWPKERELELFVGGFDVNKMEKEVKEINREDSKIRKKIEKLRDVLIFLLVEVISVMSPLGLGSSKSK